MQPFTAVSYANFHMKNSSGNKMNMILLSKNSFITFQCWSRLYFFSAEN